MSTPTVLITGAAGHLGRAVAQAFAAQGAQLVLLGRHCDTLPQGLDATRCLGLPTDLLDAAQVHAAVQAATERFGRIDTLCNVAGGFRMGEAVHATSDATWAFVHDANVRTLLLMVRAVVPHMLAQGGGAIVNVGAHAALRGVAQMGAYCAAKAEVARLTESLSAELRHQHIRVNAVLPTIIDTPDNRAAMPDADPLHWVSPHDLAQVIAFLASEGARAVHGACLPVGYQ